ncbi:hypothetical protein [Paenarthrobacter sp. NPDC091669]|uniref:hypothetical protein n=1 Tax=Paenarthrobacter sp. NPDC091669 TaxID=3364384 RepID=UPI003817F275
MPHHTNWPATVRELGEIAEVEGKTLSDLFQELLEELGPPPMPPAGFTPDRHSDVRWLGPEVMHERWIITPVWNAATDTRSVDVWLADHTPPNYAQLSAQDALDLVAALAAAARD